MKHILPAEETAFKIIFTRDPTGGVELATEGTLAVKGDTTRLDYGHNRNLIAWREGKRFFVQTLCRNSVPLYARTVKDSVWISNDVSALIIEGETIGVRLVELLFAATAASGIKSSYSHLLEDISVLHLSSVYEVSLSESGLELDWRDFTFTEYPDATKGKLLDWFIDQYEQRYAKETTISMGLSGGYDSRFELAILTSLKKHVDCFHYELFSRERKIAHQVARAVDCSFRSIPIATASPVGWALLDKCGYTTRWDGFFAAGTLPAVGLYSAMQECLPGHEKLLLNTGLLHGQVYGQEGSIFDKWRKVEQKCSILARRVFPEFESSITRECERRKAFVDLAEPIIMAKTERNDVAIDLANQLLSPRIGKMGLRQTCFYENGMPVPTGQYGARDRFFSLPVEDKAGRAFIEWALNKLDKRLSRPELITSSDDKLHRRFGAWLRVPVVRAILQRRTMVKIEDHCDWLSLPGVESIVETLPLLKSIIDRASIRPAPLYLAMISKFLSVVQERKRVSFKLVH